MARNFDGDGSGGFFASLGGATPMNPTGATSAVFEYLRERLKAANAKEPLRATKLTAPSGAHASAITRPPNRAHKEAIYNEAHVACLESLKDQFGHLPRLHLD